MGLFSLYCFLFTVAAGILITVLDRQTNIGPLFLNLESERAAILLDEGRYRDGLRRYVILLARYKAFPEVLAALLNNIAYAAVLTDEPALAETGDFASRKALELMPWVPHFKGTRGAVLLKLRRYDAALRLLNEAFAMHKERVALQSVPVGWLKRTVDLARRSSTNAIAPLLPAMTRIVL